MPDCDIPVSWCSNGVYGVHLCLNKIAGETDEEFAHRAGKALTAKLKEKPLTEDCP